MSIPCTRLDVHKVPLIIQGGEADAGGLRKWTQSFHNGISLSLGLKKSKLVFDLIFWIIFIIKLFE